MANGSAVRRTLGGGTVRLALAGVVAGLLQFIVFWVLTLVYVRRANGEFDDLNQEIIKTAWEAKK